MSELPPLPLDVRPRKASLKRRFALIGAALAGAAVGATCVSQGPRSSRDPVEDVTPPHRQRGGDAPHVDTSAAESAPAEIESGETPEARTLKLVGHWDALSAAAVAPDGESAATGSADMTIRVWDLAGKRPTKRLSGHKQLVTALALSESGERLLSGSRDRTVRLWDVAMSHEIKRFEGHLRGVTAVALSPNGGDRPEIAASGDSSGTLKLWSVERGTEMATLVAHVQEVNALVFSPDGKRLASAADDGLTFIWSVKTGKPEHGLRGHKGWVTALAISGTGARLATGGADGTIRLWDVASGRAEGILVERQGSVEQLAFAKDGEHLVAAVRGADGKALLRVWRLEDKRLVGAFSTHNPAVLALGAVEAEGRVVTIGSDELVLIRTLGPLK